MRLCTKIKPLTGENQNQRFAKVTILKLTEFEVIHNTFKIVNNTPFSLLLFSFRNGICSRFRSFSNF